MREMPSPDTTCSTCAMRMRMRPGEVGNKWVPLEWPHGHVAVQGFAAANSDQIWAPAMDSWRAVKIPQGFEAFMAELKPSWRE